MGTKLAVFGDWTLVKPKSGGTFTRSPDDQELLPGVGKKLEQMRSEGWVLAIASNQGGCDSQFVAAKEAKPGMLLYNSGIFRKISSVQAVGDGDIYQVHLNDGDIYEVSGSTPLTISFKTIEDAIEEMRFVLQLTGIEVGFFCPDMLGDAMISCVIFDSIFRHMKLTTATALQTFGVEVDGFRKPQPGMLQYIKEMTLFQTKTCLMIGDRPEDQQAAEAAGFEFEWAKNFFGGGNA
jgi:histidinol phosphatase-like enzyme